MTPDYEKAAIKATETLIKHGVSSAPVDPLPILKKIQGVIVMTFEDMSKKSNIGRKDIIDMFGCDNQDAVTSLYINDESPKYVVTYNRMLPSMVVDRALARELGHILLGHDGTRPEEVRNKEASCFSKHLMMPRALIHAISATGIRVTKEVMNNLTGCNDQCLSCIRRLPPIHVPAELNRQLRNQFMPYIVNYFDFQRHSQLKDNSETADLGSYMEGYEE